MIMSNPLALENCLRPRRIDRGWSQQELATRAEIARTSVSAIEIGRLVPSAATALSLAAVLECRVEDLFQLPGRDRKTPDWAWPTGGTRGRYWQAEVGGRKLLFPYEATHLGMIPHDGVWEDGVTHQRVDAPPPTLVMACCDPAVSLLARELARVTGIRLLAFFRSSRQALRLLKQGVVHMAGLHLARANDDGNIAAIKTELGGSYRLVRVALWEEGVATTRKYGSSLRTLIKSNARWIGREPGSGARECLDELLGSRSAPRRLARDHHGVAEAVRNGWADAGVCLRLVAEEAGLRFFTVRDEAYDLCFAEESESDPRIRRLIEVLVSPAYRRQIDDLPGFRAAETGLTSRVDCGVREKA
jgi:molybdate-binding protein/DNA-binding XRE family transcriptional regulator